MTRQTHDHNFKNLFMDFPKEALKWLMPQATENFGPIKNIEFVRQEPKKHKLYHPHLVLDMPILFVFENRKLLLWLVEFQEDKSKFSIYKLLHYTTDYMAAYPDALVIPTVLFTDRKRWRKDVVREIETKFVGRTYLHFEYNLVKLFDFNARDYFHIKNPIVKILLPKMNYKPEEKTEVIIQAYNGLYQLASKKKFEKYLDFIDIYAQIKEDEREEIFKEIIKHKETAMLAQYIKDKGRQEGILEGMQKGILEGMQKGILEGMQKGILEGMQKGMQKGRQEGMQKGASTVVSKLMAKKFRVDPEDSFVALKALSPEEIIELADKIMESDSYDDIKIWILKKTGKR